MQILVTPAPVTLAENTTEPSAGGADADVQHTQGFVLWTPAGTGVILIENVDDTPDGLVTNGGQWDFSKQGVLTVRLGPGRKILARAATTNVTVHGVRTS